MAGRTCCEAIGELAPPLLWAAPMMTVTGLPLIVTVPTTGDGGKPPPANTADRFPPHRPGIPIVPDPLIRFSQYPRASPRLEEQLTAEGGTALLVLKLIMPLAITAEVTTCSPRPF